MKLPEEELDSYYGRDRLPKKCVMCRKEYPDIIFPAFDQILPICTICFQNQEIIEKIKKEVETHSKGGFKGMSIVYLQKILGEK